MNCDNFSCLVFYSQNVSKPQAQKYPRGENLLIPSSPNYPRGKNVSIPSSDILDVLMCSRATCLARRRTDTLTCLRCWCSLVLARLMCLRTCVLDTLRAHVLDMFVYMCAHVLITVRIGSASLYT